MIVFLKKKSQKESILEMLFGCTGNFADGFNILFTLFFSCSLIIMFYGLEKDTWREWKIHQVFCYFFLMLFMWPAYILESKENESVSELSDLGRYFVILIFISIPLLFKINMSQIYYIMSVILFIVYLSFRYFYRGKKSFERVIKEHIEILGKKHKILYYLSGKSFSAASIATLTIAIVSDILFS